MIEHDPVRCSSDCKEFLFLKPYEGVVPKMKKPGFVSIETSYEADLLSLREKQGDRWVLRDCSFSLITEKARDIIAGCISRWQPKYKTHILSQKLAFSDAKTNDMLCWVETASKKLVDKNGISYPGCGPCAVKLNKSGVPTISVVSGHCYINSA